MYISLAPLPAGTRAVGNDRGRALGLLGHRSSEFLKISSMHVSKRLLWELTVSRWKSDEIDGVECVEWPKLARARGEIGQRTLLLENSIRAKAHSLVWIQSEVLLIPGRYFSRPHVSPCLRAGALVSLEAPGTSRVRCVTSRDDQALTEDGLARSIREWTYRTDYHTW